MFDLVTRGRSSGIHSQPRDWLVCGVQAVAGPLSVDCISLAETESILSAADRAVYHSISTVVSSIDIVMAKISSQQMFSLH